MLKRLFSRVRFPVVGSHSLIPQHVPVFYNVKLSSTAPKEGDFSNLVNRINELTRELERTKAEKLKRVEIELAPAKAELLWVQAELLLAKGELLQAQTELLPAQAELLRIEDELPPVQVELLQAQGKAFEAEAEALEAEAEALEAKAEALEAEAEAETSRAKADTVYMELIGNNDAYDEDEKLRIKMRLGRTQRKIL